MNVWTKSLWQASAATALVLGMSSQAQAATINYATGGSTVNIPGLTGFSTSGDEMVGMTVTAYFSGGGSETEIWAAGAPGTGGVVGTGWSLSLVGDSFAGDWTFVNGTQNSLTRLVLDGGAGLTVFDRTSPSPGTPDSASGADFSTAAGTGTITATYLNDIAVIPNGPVMDLYHILDVNFTGLTGGGMFGGFTFRQDTDNDSRLLTPEPATLALFGMGLVGLARARRRARA